MAQVGSQLKVSERRLRLRGLSHRKILVESHQVSCLTLPPVDHLKLSPVHPSRPIFRRASSASSSSSSSSSSARAPPPSNSGIGRKVAATLQLFKETSDDSQSNDAQPSTDHHQRSASLGNPVDVAEAKFEFVKRSEWPDREAAVLRRERSAVTLHRVKTRESVESFAGPDDRNPQESKSSVQDLAQWRKDVTKWDDGIDRGRRRERVDDTSEINYNPIPPWSPPQIPLPVSPPEITPRQQPTPHPPAGESPWSTDDESGWDSASASTSTTSHSTAYTHPQILPVFDDDDSPTTSFPSPDTHYRQYADADEGNENTYLLDMGTDDTLPHIPLRPFRNQVGGHSAIYKFTKRAVCKPLVSRENLFYEMVEREAPPLLAYIPRYLGVMLVSYRRVPKKHFVAAQVIHRKSYRGQDAQTFFTKGSDDSTKYEWQAPR